MMSDFCNVKNRSASVVVYSIPEDGIRRSFAPGETKKISYQELEKLTYQAGGMNILTRFLQVQSDDIIKSFNMKVEPEYYMSEKDIAALITTGSLDAFLDALDFAPTGIIDLIKKFSVSIPLVDINKREALKKKTGFDVEAALKNMRAEQEDDEKKSIDDSADATPKRRVQPESGRRTTPKYNVVAKEEKTAE